jgi:D-aminopeptidase
MTEARSRPRLRDLGLAIGRLPTGPLNAITDVAGVQVGHATVIRDAPSVARTGLTVVTPWPGARPADLLCAGHFTFNGYGEMTGAHWLAEQGLLGSPIVLTSSFAVGVFRDAMLRWRLEEGGPRGIQPVVAETNDGKLHDGRTPVLEAAHLDAALAAAAGGAVAEGGVGGGTGMVCHGFKGGIGTSSRVARLPGGARFTLGALVQANYGLREELVVAGHPVGRGLAKAPPVAKAGDGSIIVVLATDAPLLPDQCRRLARRATIGLGRVGGVGANGSGDIFLAFSTANRLPMAPDTMAEGIRALPPAACTPLFHAAAEATEEAILNALCAAETMAGQGGTVVHALPLDPLRALGR